MPVRRCPGIGSGLLTLDTLGTQLFWIIGIMRFHVRSIFSVKPHQIGEAHSHRESRNVQQVRS